MSQKCTCGATTEGKWTDKHSPDCPAVALKVSFVKESTGATVAEIVETDNQYVEVQATDDDRFDLIIHRRNFGGDTWEDITAYLTAEEFEKLGEVAKYMRARKDTP
jgi:hypothetical protein